MVTFAPLPLSANRPLMQKKTANALWCFIQDMEIEYLPAGQEPDAVLTERLTKILNHTTMRRYELVHGRVDHDGSFFQFEVRRNVRRKIAS